MKSSLIRRLTFASLLFLTVASTNEARYHAMPHARAPETAQSQPVLSAIDRTRLAEAFRLGDQIGDRVWPRWSKAPFAVLLVTSDTEFLIRHPQPSADFTKLGYDALLKSDVYYRKRQYDTGLLATFPAVGGSRLPETCSRDNVPDRCV